MLTRDDVIKALKHCTILKTCYGCPYHMGYSAECINALMRDIMALLTSEPKRGRWEEQDDGDGDISYVCSVCGERWVLNDGTPLENDMCYCPHCGSFMGEAVP